MVEVGRIACEQSGEHSAAVEQVGKSRAAPESVGTKRAAPGQGLSDRLVKRSRVRSKM
jgi:hypothetical protein